MWLNQGGLQGGAAGVFADSGQSLGSSSSESVALGDLNGDDDLDTFTANFNQPDCVWLNDNAPTPGTDVFDNLAEVDKAFLLDPLPAWVDQV